MSIDEHTPVDPAPAALSGAQIRLRLLAALVAIAAGAVAAVVVVDQLRGALGG